MFKNVYSNNDHERPNLIRLIDDHENFRFAVLESNHDNVVTTIVYISERLYNEVSEQRGHTFNAYTTSPYFDRLTEIGIYPNGIHTCNKTIMKQAHNHNNCQNSTTWAGIPIMSLSTNEMTANLPYENMPKSSNIKYVSTFHKTLMGTIADYIMSNLETIPLDTTINTKLYCFYIEELVENIYKETPLSKSLNPSDLKKLHHSRMANYFGGYNNSNQSDQYNIDHPVTGDFTSFQEYATQIALYRNLVFLSRTKNISPTNTSEAFIKILQTLDKKAPSITSVDRLWSISNTELLEHAIEKGLLQLSFNEIMVTLRQITNYDLAEDIEVIMKRAHLFDYYELMNTSILTSDEIEEIYASFQTSDAQIITGVVLDRNIYLKMLQKGFSIDVLAEFTEYIYTKSNQLINPIDNQKILLAVEALTQNHDNIPLDLFLNTYGIDYS